MSTYSRVDNIGDIGVNLVSTIVTRDFHWVFREQTKTDLGIDAQLEITTQNGKSTGRLIAAQIKTGTSFFKKSNEDGFWFYGENKHLEYWLNHSLAVILILCDHINNECYWVDITNNNIKKLKKNWKVLVPKNQKLSIEYQDKLITLSNKPQHYDIVNLLLFKFLSDKYHKYSEFGRLDICPLIDEPRDLMYITCMAEFEKTSQIVYICHHYDLFEKFSISKLNQFIEWYHLNNSTLNIENTLLYVFTISDNLENLSLSKEMKNILNENPWLSIFRLKYKQSTFTERETFYYLVELDENDEEICFY